MLRKFLTALFAVALTLSALQMGGMAAPAQAMAVAASAMDGDCSHDCGDCGRSQAESCPMTANCAAHCGLMPPLSFGAADILYFLAAGKNLSPAFVSPPITSIKAAPFRPPISSILL